MTQRRGRPISRRGSVPLYECVHLCGRLVSWSPHWCGKCENPNTESLRDFRKRVIERNP